MTPSTTPAAVLRRARVLVAVVLVAYTAVLLGRPLSASATGAVDDLAQLGAALTAALSCALAAHRAGRGRAGRAWWLLAAATASWGVGQGIWTYAELVADREVPFPSPADAGFLAFPLLAGVGLMVLPVGRGAATSRLRNLLDGLVSAGSLLVLSWAASLGEAVTESGRVSLATVLGVAYPLADVVLLTLVLLVLGRADRSQRSLLVPLAAGLAALAIADTSFLYLTAHDAYGSGDLCGVGWTGGFLLVALAAGAVTRDGARGSGGTDRAAGLDAAEQGLMTSRVRLALPYVPLLLAQAVVTAQLLAGDRRAPAFEVAVALGLVLLVLARQFLVMADNRSLLVALKEEREAARHAALHDPLTGLANRTLFTDRVEHALALRTRDPGATSVMFCDVDDFKTVNDALGHAAGDALLVAVAERLQASLRPGDTVARIGGDEFALLIESCAEPPEQIAARLVAALAEPVRLVDRLLTVSASVGLVTSWPGDDRLDCAELLRRADAAMYAAKDAGKDTWVAYEHRAHGLHRGDRSRGRAVGPDRTEPASTGAAHHVAPSWPGSDDGAVVGSCAG